MHLKLKKENLKDSICPQFFKFFGGPKRYNCAMGNELIFEGKKYISAKRASQITGYNSDYIGQLCRKGSLECRLVGRSWFVEEKSLSEHQVIASKAPRGRIPFSAKTSAKNSVVKIIAQPEQKEDQKVVENIQPNFDAHIIHAYDRNLFVAPVTESTEDKAFVKKIVGISIAIVLTVLSSQFFVGQNKVSNITAIVNTGSHIAIEINSSASKQIASVVSSVKNSGLALATDNDSIHEFRIKTHAFTLETYHRISMIPNILFSTARTMKTLVMRGGEKESNVREDVSAPGTRSGITVVPSTGDAAKDEKVKQYIKDSFSDETNVVPDQSGTSGVIKPVFKKQSDQDYIYVIVPTKQ